LLAVEQHLTGGPRPWGEIVHPVEDAKEGRLAAARWADQRRDLARLDRHDASWSAWKSPYQKLT